MFSFLLQGPGEEEKCVESEPVAPAADVEAEAWSERTAVITRYDHETHCQLARSFVEDLVDQVVEQSAKEEEPKPAEIPVEKPTIRQQKQSLFLPDLVPNVVIPQPAPPVTESESDEYESADEQPLHGE